MCRVQRVWQWLAVAVLAAGGCGQKALQPSDFAAQRQQMVERQLMTRGINDQRVLAAMAKNAEAILQRLGYKNVHLKIGDGYKGWPDAAPFDAIIVTCAPDKVPQPLIDQLKDGGRMVIPVGDIFAQQLYLLEKKNGQLKQSATLPVRFVPMSSEQKK